MKPVKLVIEGINSFTDAQTLDFDSVGRINLFCICGKTGAGKTTIFDSIMLALYGRSNKGNLADVVNLSRMTGKVKLDFIANGELYGVERTIKCRFEKDADGKPTEKRAAMSECTLFRNGAPVAKGEEASSKIQELIGLEFGEFKSVYMLEQGEYAEFLKKPSAKQLEAVGKIFSLMRFGDVYKLANEKKRDADGMEKATQQRIDDIGDIDDGTLKQKRSELASLRAKSRASVGDLNKKREFIKGLETLRDAYLSAVQKQRVVTEHLARLEEANDRLGDITVKEREFEKTDKTAELKAALDGLREKQNALAALAALDRELMSTEADGAQKRTALIKKAREEEEIAKRLDALKARNALDLQRLNAELDRFRAAAGGLSSPSEAVQRALTALDGTSGTVTSAYYELCAEKNAYDELYKEYKAALASSENAKRLGDAEFKKLEAYNAERLEADKRTAAARDALGMAEKALLKAQIGSHAAAVMAELAPGDVCPVCGGIFSGNSCEDTDVQNRKAEKDAAERELKKCEKAAAELEKLADAAKTEYGRQCAECDRYGAKQKELAARLAATGVEPERYVELIAVLASAKAVSEKCEASAREYGAAQPELSAVRAEKAAAQKAAEESESKAKELAAKLGDMRGRTERAVADIRSRISDTEKELAGYADRLRVIAAERDAAKATVATVEQMLAAARRDCPKDIPEFDEEDYRKKREEADRLAAELGTRETEIGKAEAETAQLEKDLARKKELIALRNEHTKRGDRYKIISDMTKGKAMLNYVATEYIEDFTSAASEILGVLSSGKYSMSYDRDGGFVVSDYLNNGKSRKTDTLSGGELFLASLSVAIAIARAVGSGGDNAFFFLDEGFGTLDEELIDTVYAALEELAKTCLVGVISHSGPLIERMPACVTVEEATDLMGSRIKY